MMPEPRKEVIGGALAEECWPLIRNFHYSGRMPSVIQHCFAVRHEGGLFGDTGELQAAAIFSIPPTRWSEDVIELTRLVRNQECITPLSKLLAFSCGWLKKAGHILIVSFADRTQNHHGGIYQAANWNYDGCRERRMDGVLIDGVFKPGRSCNATWGTQSPLRLREILRGRDVRPHYDEGKHLYWKALCVAGKTRAKRLGLKASPYPKPNAGSPLDERGSPACEAGEPPAARSKLRPAPPKQEVMEI